MIVTKIQGIRGRRPRYKIFLDDSTILEISDWALGKSGVRVGDEIDDEKISSIKKTEEETSAKNSAINFISYRVRSLKETKNHLLRKGYTQEIIDGIIPKLKEIGMIDDVAFTRMYARDQLKKKSIGEMHLRQKLILKGIDRNTIDSVLSECIRPEQQLSKALTIAQRKMKPVTSNGARIEFQKQRKRVYDFLMRRGFSSEIVQQTLKHLFTNYSYNNDIE